MFTKGTTVKRVKYKWTKATDSIFKGRLYSSHLWLYIEYTQYKKFTAMTLYTYSFGILNSFLSKYTCLYYDLLANAYNFFCFGKHTCLLPCEDFCFSLTKSSSSFSFFEAILCLLGFLKISQRLEFELIFFPFKISRLATILVSSLWFSGYHTLKVKIESGFLVSLGIYIYIYIYNEKSLQEFGISKLQTTLTCLCTNLSVSSRDRETIKFMAFDIIFLSS